MRDHTAAVISAKLDNDEINDAASPTLAFHIGRHAVTVDQFRAYVQHSGQVPGSPHTMQPADNHPVVKVSFHDALAYCAWLQDRLINDPALAAWPPGRCARRCNRVLCKSACPANLNGKKPLGVACKTRFSAGATR